MDIAAMIAVAVAAGTTPAAASASQPIRLEVESQGSASVVRVVAQGGAGACTATYALAVSGNAGGNRSVNRGTIKLPASGAVTAASVKVGNAAGAGITATLDVTPCGAPAYRQSWPPPAKPSRG